MLLAETHKCLVLSLVVISEAIDNYCLDSSGFFLNISGILCIEK